MKTVYFLSERPVNTLFMALSMTGGVVAIVTMLVL